MRAVVVFVWAAVMAMFGLWTFLAAVCFASAFLLVTVFIRRH